MNSKVWLAGRAAAVAGHMLTERVRPPVPRTPDDVPRNGVELTEDWLTQVLCEGHPGARVVS